MIVGNINNDPELRYSQSGLQICTFYLKTEKFDNLRTICFGDLGERITKGFKKGERVILSGYMKDDTWKDRNGEIHKVKLFKIKGIKHKGA